MKLPQQQETISVDALIDRVFLKCEGLKRKRGDDDSSAAEDDVARRIEDVASAVFYQQVPRDYITSRVAKYRVWQRQLQELQRIPVIQQRSEEWYAARQTLITASDFAQALGEGKFGTQRQFFAKKCGYDDTPFDGNLPPLRWGVMFEPVATAIYSARNNVRVHEFGLIRHPRIDYLGASPDGITDLGVMVEVKCPYRRKINGEVPTQYYYQIQGQLDVCGLEECDYLECEFVCCEDAAALAGAVSAKGADEHGMIVEYEDGSFEYGPVHRACMGDVLREGEQHQRLLSGEKNETNAAKGDSGQGGDGVAGTEGGVVQAVQAVEAVEAVKAIKAVHYWYLSVFNVAKVRRDDAFLAEKLPLLGDVWQKVLQYRADRELYVAEVEKAPPRGRRVTAAAVSSPGGQRPAQPGQQQITGYSFIDV